MHSMATALFDRLRPANGWRGRVTRATPRRDAIAGLSNAAFRGSSMVMVSGPTTAISAVVFASLVEMTPPGEPPYVAMALTLTIMVGVFQLVAGFARLGRLITFVSHSAMIGFTAAAAILIAASQRTGARAEICATCAVRAYLGCADKPAPEGEPAYRDAPEPDGLGRGRCRDA